jgi:hypothetical protein
MELLEISEKKSFGWREACSFLYATTTVLACQTERCVDLSFATVGSAAKVDTLLPAG